MDDRTSPTRDLIAFLLSLAAAWTVSFAMWAWWVSYDNPLIWPRPHPATWDILDRSFQLRGEQIAAGPLHVTEKWLIDFAARTMNACGESFAGMTAYQVPVMFALLLGVGLIGWRFGGRVGGIVAPWVAAFAPMTVGLATQPDDLLFLQAMVSLALACLFWSDRPGWGWLGFLAVVPMVAAVRNTLWFSVNLLLLFVFLTTGATWLLAQWRPWRRSLSGRSGEIRGLWLGAAALAFTFAVAFVASFPIDFGYILGEASRADVKKESVWQAPSMVAAVPYVWIHFMAGPWIALAATGGVAAAIWRRRFWDFAPVVAWFLSLTVLITLVNKRDDFYLPAIVPASYVLAAAPLGALLTGRLRRLAAILLVTVLAASWLTTVQRDFKPYEKQIAKATSMYLGMPVPYLVAPWSPPLLLDQRDTGDWAAATCGGAHRFAVVADPVGINGTIGFRMWLKYPGMLVGDLRRGPIYADSAPCLVMRTPFGAPQNHAVPMTDALANFLQRALEAGASQEEGFADRYQRLTAMADDYRPVGAYHGWIVYLPR